MARSAKHHGEKLLDNVYGAERTLNEGMDRIEDFDDTRRKHRERKLGFLHPEVLRAEVKLAAYIPRLAIGGLSKVAKGIYHQCKYAHAAEVDFIDAAADAMDRFEPIQSKDRESDAA